MNRTHNYRGTTYLPCINNAERSKHLTCAYVSAYLLSYIRESVQQNSSRTTAFTPMRAACTNRCLSLASTGQSPSVLRL